MITNNLQKFNTNPDIPCYIPTYQKSIVEAIREGSPLWTDTYGKTTYHIKIKKRIHNIIQPHIAALIFRGFLDEETLVLTDYGAKVKLL